MAGLQQFYFFPTDFLDTIRDHPSIPLDAREDEGKSGKTIIALRDSVEKSKDSYKKMKLSSDSLPIRVASLKKSKKKIDL